jgi:hypothetical protein
MYGVTDTYKLAMADNLRQRSTLLVAHIVPNSNNSADTADFPTGMLVNDTQNYFNDQVQSATFEPMGCILDGSYYLRGDGVEFTNKPDEYVSDVASATDKSVGINDYTILFDEASITDLNVPKDIYLGFDSKSIVRPTEITITMQDNAGSTLGSVGTYSITDFSAQLELPTIPTSNLLRRIKISVVDMNLPYAYVRFEKVILGSVNVFNDTKLVGGEWKEASSPLTFEIPTADLSFTFLDPEKEYHITNPDNKFDGILENQQVGFKFGLDILGGGTEWVNGGLYRTTGEKRVSDEIIPRVTIQCRHASVNADESVREIDDTLVSLDNVTEVAVSLTDPAHSLTTLLTEVGVDMTIDSYDSGANLNDTATIVDSNITLKQYTQIISNAYGMLWSMDRTNEVAEAIKLIEFSKLKMDATDNYDSQALNLYRQGANPDAPLVSEFTNYYNGVYLFQFNNSNLLELPRISTVPISDGISYAQYNHMTNVTERGLYPISATGKRLINVNNPFVTVGFLESQGGAPSTDAEPNKLFGRYVWDYYQEHKVYTLINRGYPELDVGDIVHLYVKYYEEDGATIAHEPLSKRCIVISNKVSYDGTIRGETAVLEWDIVLDENYGV